MANKFDQAAADVLNALLYERFGRDKNAAAFALQRALQSTGWEQNLLVMHEFSQSIERGAQFLHDSGLIRKG